MSGFTQERIWVEVKGGGRRAGKIDFFGWCCSPPRMRSLEKRTGCWGFLFVFLHVEQFTKDSSWLVWWFQPSTRPLTESQKPSVPGDDLGLFHFRLKLRNRLGHKHKYLDLDVICSKRWELPMTQQVEDKYNDLYFREFLGVLPGTSQMVLLRIYS